ncbi:hypothetical protein MTR67_048643 [Solanum verrucosum]|uniref:Reverse transcriptase domain-containing protein n=1 Tax=Solanum verrucosum TaxID=315347 RepID=A0AAF0V1W5_SOLVR|nr:hypothetical protein MTR67_048643 [Solanum verrucosum]
MGMHPNAAGIKRQEESRVKAEDWFWNERHLTLDWCSPESVAASTKRESVVAVRRLFLHFLISAVVRSYFLVFRWVVNPPVLYLGSVWKATRSLKEDISGWNRESSDKLEVQKGRLLDDLSILEQSVEGRLMAQLEKERSLHLKLRLHEIAKIEEISSRQKSRCLRLKGNKNTKFFSRITNSQKRINRIDKLLTGDEVGENNNIKAGILRFYQALYIEEEQWTLEKRQIIDASLIANEMLHGRLKSGTPGIMCKLDVEKAFDKANWSYLLSLLSQMEFGSRPNYFISVSHLLYANDTLIFYGAEKLQVQYLNLVIMLFEIISGLHINMLKSKIYPVNTAPNLNELANIMACEIGSYPATYLGMPLRAKYKEKEARNKVIKQVDKRLGNWHMQYLSMGGRLTLINSVLDNIPRFGSSQSIDREEITYEQKGRTKSHEIWYYSNYQNKGYR